MNKELKTWMVTVNNWGYTQTDIWTKSDMKFSIIENWKGLSYTVVTNDGKPPKFELNTNGYKELLEIFNSASNVESFEFEDGSDNLDIDFNYSDNFDEDVFRKIEDLMEEGEHFAYLEDNGWNHSSSGIANIDDLIVEEVIKGKGE